MKHFTVVYYKDEQVLLFCIAIQYRSPGNGIAILLWKMSNTGAIPEKIVQAKRGTAYASISDRVTK